MFEYYGLDWLLLASGLTTKYLMIHQNRWAFMTSIIGCSAGLVLAILADQYGLILFNAILIAMSFQGFSRWGKISQKAVNQPAQPTPQTA